MTFQTIVIAGNLGRDPELRSTTNGKEVCSFSVAVSEGKDKTAWFRVSAWDKQAELCNTYLKKGSKVLVEGILNFDTETGGPRQYQAKDGTTKTAFDITARTVRFLSPKAEIVESDESENPF